MCFDIMLHCELLVAVAIIPISTALNAILLSHPIFSLETD